MVAPFAVAAPRLVCTFRMDSWGLRPRLYAIAAPRLVFLDRNKSWGLRPRLYAVAAPRLVFLDCNKSWGLRPRLYATAAPQLQRLRPMHHPINRRTLLKASGVSLALPFLESITLGTMKPQSQSYTSGGVMIPAETRPANLFARMFLEGKPEELRAQQQRLTDGCSILD